MFTVDRPSFVLWVSGILLDRDKDGKCLVGDGVSNEEAERRLDKGETIGLTENGVIVSTMSFQDGKYRERKAEDGSH